MKSLYREAAWHLAFWIGYLVLRLVVIQLYPGSFMYRLSVELIEIPLKAFALYALIYLLVPKFLLQKRIFLFTTGLAILTLVVMWLNRVEDYYLIYPLTHSDYVRYEAGFADSRTAFFNLIYIYPVVAIGATIYFVRQWIADHWIKERLAREKAEIELKVLKDQIHPHFLFNSMNNIYSLALNGSPKAPEMMLRLSKLLSYMVYDASRSFVAATKEIQALHDYIELEKLRLGDRLNISFTVTGHAENFAIAPLLLFPLLENCFKHGSHQTSEAVWINFHIHFEDGLMTVQLENSLPAAANRNRSNSGGIGIENIRQRLQLIYPNHVFRIHVGETYLVLLKIRNHGEMPDNR